MRTKSLLIAGVAAALLAGCPAEEPADEPPDLAEEPTPTPTPTPTPSPSLTPEAEPSPRRYVPLPGDLVLTRELVAEGLEQVVALATAPDDGRIFAVEKRGRIVIVENGVVRDEPFLDLRDDVLAGGPRSEQGMFSLAFHPDYRRNGRLFVYYVTAGDNDTRLEEFRVSSDPNRVDMTSRRTILDVPQPFRWHNGGKILLGRDGMLWLSLGDGGVSGDPDLVAQDRSNLLGTIVRIDVDSGDPYGIPPDNPFVDDDEAASEVWAYGLRNPWRMDLDRVEDLLYVGDVGQHRFEWVNVVPAGEGGWNFGWPVLEGSRCFPEHADRCPGEGFTDPVFEYVHDGVACAVIGGIVYDGPAIPAFAGHYLYTDFCAGWLRSFRFHDGEVRDEMDWTETVGRFDLPTTFGRDPAGEPLVADTEGRIWRIVAEGV